MFVKTLKHVMYLEVVMLVLSACSGSMDSVTAAATPAASMHQPMLFGDLIPTASAATSGVQSPSYVNVTHSPEDGEQQVSVNLSAIMISFDRPVDAGSVSLESLSINPAVNAAVNKQELASSYSVSFAMMEALKARTTYTLELSGIRDVSGIEIPPKSWQFVTGDNIVITTDTIPPSAPENLRTIVSPTAFRVYLTWDASMDDTGVTGYRVIRDDVVLASVTKPAFADRTVTENTIYQYAIQAYDAAGNVATSEKLTLNTPGAGNTGSPAPPANVRFSVLTNAQVTILWDAPDDSAGVSGYRVYRDAVLLASTSSTFYSDLTVTAGAAYRYSIVALDYDGNYAISEPFQLDMPPLYDKTAIITWTNPVINEDGTCTAGIVRNELSYGKFSGDYTHSDDIDLSTDASCITTGYDNDCNLPVMDCKYRSGELATTTWYFALQARDWLGRSSPFSNEITALIK